MKDAPRILIVEARFYDHLNDLLLEGARAAIEAAGHTHETVTVPGALEIPGAVALAAAVDPGWSMAIQVALLFVIVEPIAGHVVEPLLYGHSTGLSPIAVILAATIWTFLWGPIGLLLATPLTVCLVVLGRHVERLWFLDVILGDEQVSAVFVNVFGGITACDEVANGIKGALEILGDAATKPLVVRLDGNNVEEGRRILAEANHPLVTVVDTMDGAARRAAEVITAVAEDPGQPATCVITLADANR